MSENIQGFLGETFTEVKVNDERDQIDFITPSYTYRMFHRQDCCESVGIEDIAGNLDDLVGSSITLAEESVNTTDRSHEEYPDSSWTWTFYRFATAKGYVTIRWYGSSNGYYSESVDFDYIDTRDSK